MSLYEIVVAPFVEFEFMRRALAGTSILALSACPVGVFLMLRRMSLAGDAIAHAVLPGAAVGFVLAGLNVLPMTIGGLVAGLLVASLSGACLADDDPARGCEPRRVLPHLAGARRAARLAAGIEHRSDACPVRLGSRAQRPGDLPGRRHRHGDPRWPGARLAGARRRMPRPVLPPHGQRDRPLRPPDIPAACRPEPRGRVPDARHAALRRADDPAGGRRTVLGASTGDHVSRRGRDRTSSRPR